MRKYLKKIREEQQKTQNEVAQKLNVSEGYYSMIENGERKKKLDLEIAVKLSEIFSVDVSWIIEKEKELAVEEG